MKAVVVVYLILIMGALSILGSCNESVIDLPDEATSDLKSEAFLLNEDGSLAGTVSELEIISLLFVYEEEKMARDVYDYLYSVYGAKVFSNIKASEQTHMDKVLYLIEGYEIENTGSKESGVFTNEEIAGIYEDLISQGSESLEQALRVGAFIEEYDIIDLEEWIEEVSNENIKLVYSNLETGSENHLRAFARNLSNLGVIYDPELLESSVYEEILSGSNGGGNSSH